MPVHMLFEKIKQLQIAWDDRNRRLTTEKDYKNEKEMHYKIQKW